MKLDEIEALEKEATPGPWRVGGLLDMSVISYDNDTLAHTLDANGENAKFIASSREFVPWAIDEIRRISKHVEILIRANEYLVRICLLGKKKDED